MTITHDPLRVPYLESPDWSKGLIVEENDTAHDVSKFAGAGGVEILSGAALAKLAKARVAAQCVRGTGDDIANWLGKFTIKRNDAKGFVAVSKDGLRKCRFDFDGHGFPPHGHLEVLDQAGDWVDAIPGQHRLPFTQ